MGSRIRGMTRTPGGLTAAAIALVVMSLAGCTPPNTLPSPTPTFSETPEETPTAEPTSGEAAAAVVTIAAVDVDGLTATVSGYVTQVKEDGGACTFEVVSALTGDVVTAESVGIANVSSTSCTTLQIPIEQLAKGSWTVTLKYKSEDTDVTSEPVTMEVP